MTERVIEDSDKYLEALLHDLQTKLTTLSGLDSVRRLDEEQRISNIAKLFLKLLKESEVISHETQSLNVVLPGVGYNEVIGAHLATQALGISEVNILGIEGSPAIYEGEKDMLQRFGQLGNSNISLISGDAGSPAYKNQLAQADATMVFMGNAQGFMGKVFDMWSTVGKETQKPFLFATTATKNRGEKEAIERLFVRAQASGDLTTVMGMQGIPNPYAFTRGGMLNHQFLFVAARK